MKALLSAIVLFFSFNVQAEQDRALFWRLQSASATVYLLGSIHYADASFYPLRAAIEQAFEHSDRLVVEVNMDANAGAQVRQLIQDKGMYRGDETIRDHLRADTHTSLLARLQQLDIPYALVAQQKPGLMIMTLASLQMQKLGFSPEQGIDAYFLRRATRLQKPVLELESIEQQLHLLLNISDGDLLLQETLSEFETMDESMAALVQGWKQGDEASLNTLLFEDVLTRYPAYLGIYQELFYKRNIAMTKKIEDYLNTRHSYFIIVGAGHLIGDKSVVALLNKNNYKVTRF